MIKPAVRRASIVITRRIRNQENQIESSPVDDCGLFILNAVTAVVALTKATDFRLHQKHYITGKVCNTDINLFGQYHCFHRKYTKTMKSHIWGRCDATSIRC